jgi:aminotransferase
VAAEDLMNAIRKAHDFTTVCAPTPLQMAALAAMGLGDDYYAQLSRDYRRRRELLLGVLCEVGFDPVVPEGAYYMMADFSALSDMDDESFARYLIKGVGVATVPGSSFYYHKSLGRSKVRFTFCKREETLHAAAERLRNIKGGKASS